jgi:hypothetical protein
MPTKLTPTSLPEFQRYQHTFTAHIRDPQKNSCPGEIDARRMQVYKSLVYNGIEGSLTSCFPVLKKVLGQRRWPRLVRTFIAKHPCHSPFFYQIPDEFIQFLQTAWKPTRDYPAFALELAHYEWIELSLSISTQSPDWKRIDPAGDLLKQRPVLNPVFANLHYRWPVHRIAPRRRVIPQDTFLLVYRDKDDQIKFIEINAFTAHMLNLLKTTDHNGQTTLEIIAKESGHPNPEIVRQGGMSAMQELFARGVLLGVLCD